MSAEVNPSIVSWLTSMMTMRLQVILEHIPVTEDQILHYVVHAQVSDVNTHKHDRNPDILNLCVNGIPFMRYQIKLKSFKYNTLQFCIIRIYSAIFYHMTVVI